MVSKVLFGSALLVGRSFTIKFIGLLSTLVLARMLAPEDFGLVAMATLALGFLQIFAATGTGLYVLRAAKVDDELLNSAWTLDLILKLIVAAALAIVAPTISRYYQEPQLTNILYALAGLMALGTLRSPGVMLLQREQAFGRIVTLSIVAKVLGAIAGVSIALIYQSYWALVVGQIVNGICGVIGSYVIHPHRPRPCVRGIRRQLRFSGWLIPQAMLGFGRTQFDTFLVSTTFGNAELGSFNTMKYLAYIPGQHILLPATQPLLAELSQSRDNPKHFRFQHNVSFLVTLALALAMASLLAGTAEPLIRLVLGEQWGPYSGLFYWFALLLPAYALFHHATRTLLVFGRTKYTVLYELFAVLFIFIPILMLGLEDVEAFTARRVSLELIASFIFLCATTWRYTSLANTLRLLLLSLPVCGACMAGLLAAQLLPASWPAIPFLAAYCSAFLLVFAIVLLLCATTFRQQRECRYLLDKLYSVLRKLMRVVGKA